jgi:hypothetical protein
VQVKEQGPLEQSSNAIGIVAPHPRTKLAMG